MEIGTRAATPSRNRAERRFEGREQHAPREDVAEPTGALARLLEPASADQRLDPEALPLLGEAAARELTGVARERVKRLRALAAGQGPVRHIEELPLRGQAGIMPGQRVFTC